MRNMSQDFKELQRRLRDLKQGRKAASTITTYRLIRTLSIAGSGPRVVRARIDYDTSSGQPVITQTSSLISSLSKVFGNSQYVWLYVVGMETEDVVLDVVSTAPITSIVLDPE